MKIPVSINPLGAPLSQASFDASLDHVLPTKYNKWRVCGAKPVGIFVLDPTNILVRQKIACNGPFGPEEIVAAEAISLDDVRATFPGQPIWTMMQTGPKQI